MVFEPEIYLQVDAFDDIDIRIRILKGGIRKGMLQNTSVLQ